MPFSALYRHTDIMHWGERQEERGEGLTSMDNFFLLGGFTVILLLINSSLLMGKYDLT